MVPLVAITVMFLWALCYPFISIGLEYSPPLLFAFIRAILAGFALLLLAKLLGRPPIVGKNNWIAIVVIALTATTVGFWGMFYAGGILSPGLATVLTNTQPLIAAVIGWYVLDEKLSKKSIIGLFLGFSGIVVIGLGSMNIHNEELIRGIGYVLFASIGIAVSNIFLKRIAAQVDSLYAMGWQLFLGAFPLAIMSLYLEDYSEFQLTPDLVTSLLVLSLFGTSLAFVLWFWLLTRVPLYQANAYSFLTPILGMLIGFLFYSEVLTLSQILGAVAVIAGIWAVNSTRSRELQSS
ncbi:MAG: EamA family transporter [Blastopirellula sp.]|nr:MAG: EamA family transporter [Blastopirellula sp.]